MYAASGVQHPDPVILIAHVDLSQASRQLRAEVVAGRLDSEAVEAVLAAAGHRVPAGSGPAGASRVNTSARR
jgi:hypothetical protein